MTCSEIIGGDDPELEELDDPTRIPPGRGISSKSDSCPVKSCCEKKGLQHCGECDDFVCPLLHTFAYDMEQSDNGARIEQCQKWCNNNGIQ